MINKTGNSVFGKSNLQIPTIIYNSMDLYSIILVLINYMLEILIRREIQVQVNSTAKKPDQMPSAYFTFDFSFRCAKTIIIFSNYFGIISVVSYCEKWHYKLMQIRVYKIACKKQHGQ